VSALNSDGFIDFIRWLMQEPKDKAVFQDKLKHRPHFCHWLSLAFRISTDLRRLDLRSPILEMTLRNPQRPLR